MDSGFDQEVSCSLEAALEEPWDPWGETWVGRNLNEWLKGKNRGLGFYLLFTVLESLTNSINIFSSPSKTKYIKVVEYG